MCVCAYQPNGQKTFSLINTRLLCPRYFFFSSLFALPSLLWRIFKNIPYRHMFNRAQTYINKLRYRRSYGFVMTAQPATLTLFTFSRSNVLTHNLCSQSGSRKMDIWGDRSGVQQSAVLSRLNNIACRHMRVYIYVYAACTNEFSDIE